jgi:ubiquinone/menaquinone biosynthesis C-methylase UbiE
MLDDDRGTQDAVRHGASIRSVAAPVTDWLIDALAVQPGETILELAAGAGDAGFATIERLGPGGRLISSDVSPATVEVARRAAAERAFDGIEFRVLDAQHMELPSASVDSVICRWGFMLMSDPASAFRETARVLRSAGHLAFSVWGDPKRNPWTTIDAEVCARLGYASPSAQSDPGEIFSLADPARLREMVEASGFAVRRLESVAVDWPYASAEDYLAVEVGQEGPRAEYIRGQLAVGRALASTIGAELLEPFRTDAGYLVPGETLNVLADKG